MPVGVKDVIDTADMPTSYGSPIYAGHRPVRDADCVTWLREQGAVILGKTVTTEFATYQPPPTVNPHDPERTPGGSSSGSAAAVADGMVPLAYGTQTAGSVIRPASFCGVVGFKPAHGWHSTAGIKRLSARLDTLGTFGRTVADAALLAGFEPVAGRAADRVVPHAVVGRRRGSQCSRRPAAGWGSSELELPAEFAGLADAQETVMAYDVARNLEPEWASHRELLSDAMRDYLKRAWTVRRRGRRGRGRARRRLPRRWPEVLGELDAAARPGGAGRGAAAVGGPHRRSAVVPRVDVAGRAGDQRAGDERAGGDAGRGAARRARRGRRCSARPRGSRRRSLRRPHQRRAISKKPSAAASSAAIEHDSSVRCACSASPGPQMIVGGSP